MTKKSERRVVNYADELFEEWRSDSEKSRGKKFLRRDFSYGEAQRRKGEERVVIYADERFRAATKPDGKDRSKKLFENYTEEEMT